MLCRLRSLEFGALFLACFFSLTKDKTGFLEIFFCAEQFCKSCFYTSSFCQPSTLRTNHNHSQLLEASQPLRQGILFLSAADIIQSPKEILKVFSFFPKYCSDSQINLTFNLWSGLCPLVCIMSPYFLDKCSFIFCNQDFFFLPQIRSFICHH